MRILLGYDAEACGKHSSLIRLPLDKMTAISQTIFSDAF